MTFSNRERRLFLAGLFALGILGVFLFRRKPRLRAIPPPKPFPLPDAAVHPSDPQLGALRFSVDRKKKTVCAHDVATGRLVWESSGSSFPARRSPSTFRRTANFGWPTLAANVWNGSIRRPAVSWRRGNRRNPLAAAAIQFGSPRWLAAAS